MHEELKAPAESVRAKTGEWLQRPRVRLGAVVAVAAAAGIIAWAVVGSGGGSSHQATPPSRGAVSGGIGPIGLSPEGLRAQSRSLRKPIYWAGPKRGYTYELTRTVTGRFYVRYLPPGTAVGAKGADYLIIATYPFPKTFAALKRVSGGKGISLPGGGLAVVDTNYPKSVHLAFPGIDYQVEVYDPSPARARAVAVSGSVRPVR
jgi:hypothetical protein